MKNENLIFDVGMHIGQDTAFYLTKGFNVIAVDANPLLAQAASKRFSREIEHDLLKIVNAGAGDVDGVFPFYVNANHSEWSSFDKEIGSRGGCKEVLSIPMIPFENLLQQYGIPYYLKIDIEGYDFIILQRLAHVSERPKYISVENGEPYMLEHLIGLGYTGFKFINQAEVSRMRCPEPAREGKDIPWTFPFGASGPFGEDTPGDWECRDEIIKKINAYWGNPERDDNIHGWYDLHAKLA